MVSFLKGLSFFYFEASKESNEKVGTEEQMDTESVMKELMVCSTLNSLLLLKSRRASGFLPSSVHVCFAVSHALQYDGHLSSITILYLSLFLGFCLFLERGKAGRKNERETLM